MCSTCPCSNAMSSDSVWFYTNFYNSIRMFAIPRIRAEWKIVTTKCSAGKHHKTIQWNGRIYRICMKWGDIRRRSRYFALFWVLCMCCARKRCHLNYYRHRHTVNLLSARFRFACVFVCVCSSARVAGWPLPRRFAWQSICIPWTSRKAISFSATICSVNDI